MIGRDRGSSIESVCCDGAIHDRKICESSILAEVIDYEAWIFIICNVKCKCILHLWLTRYWKDNSISYLAQSTRCRYVIEESACHFSVREFERQSYGRLSNQTNRWW
jgi:hypothetical protein